MQTFVKLLALIAIFYQSYSLKLTANSISIDCDSCDGLSGSVTVSPSPIKLPGDVSFTAKGKLNVEVPSTASAKTTLQKHLFGSIWIDIPCTDGLIGDCTIDDACSLITKFGLPKPCPISPQSFDVSDTVPVNESITSLEVGDYRGTIKIYDGSKEIICTSGTFSLSD